MALMSGYFSSSAAAGTFSYAAPELIMGEKCSAKVSMCLGGWLSWPSLRIVTFPDWQLCLSEKGQCSEPCAPSMGACG